MIPDSFKKKVNDLSARGIPYFFIIDFEMNNPFVCSLEEAEQENIFYDIRGKSNFNYTDISHELKIFNKYPVSEEEYSDAFNKVGYHLNRGDTYLVNLTFPTRLETNLSLNELFLISKAPYKLLFKDKFLVFSPECFVKIIDDVIYSYPMKGTIDASVPDAENILLNKQKEIFEHNTIVDLIRNDLSLVADNVEVSKFRFVTRIKTNQKDLLQVSSEIKGVLNKGWKDNPGELLMKMLPAGSVSGAPKQKTVEIIRSAEKNSRGYFTGIFGIFDGSNLESAVNIRFIESVGGDLYFRSGGGITALSDSANEYSEMIDKVYVPAG